RGVELPAAFLLAMLSHRTAPAAVCTAAAHVFRSASPAVIALVRQTLGVSLMWKGLVLAAALGMTAVGIGIGGALLAEPEPVAKMPRVVSDPGKQPANEQPVEVARPRLDRFGDPLPEDALARFGTVRWRQGSIVTAIQFSPDDKTMAI